MLEREELGRSRVSITIRLYTVIVIIVMYE